MQDFWRWYNRHYALNVTIAAALFTLQIIHLVWLTFDPLWFKVFGDPLVHDRGSRGAGRCCSSTTPRSRR